jgi:anaerobic selenocysteine-containing dehydrogenase
LARTDPPLNPLRAGHTSHVRGVCPHNCPDTCGWVVTVENGAPVRIEGDADHPYTRGWLCTKVNRYLEFVLHPDRLRQPMRRVGRKGEGRFEPISWEAALDLIVARWQGLIDQHGPESIVPYSYSGTLGAVQSAVANTRFWARLGASQLERTICSAAGTEAARLTVGGSYGTDPEAAVHSRLILLWGTNPASTHPHFIPILDEARRRGARVVLIDPHRTLTANRADLHLQPRPGSDAALALAMMHVLFAEGLVNRAWAEAHTVGLAALEARVREYTPEWAAGITGLDAGEISDLARAYASESPSLIKCSMGLQRHTNGGNTIRCLACLPALTGSYGTLGGGFLYSTGGHLTWPGRAICPGGVAPRNQGAPAPRVINMNRIGEELLTADPPIRSLYVFNSNPAAVAPAGGKVRAGLEREDLFTVVHELFLTDTAMYADILLPATSQFEHWDLHKAYGHLYLSLNRPVMPPLGEAKSNWEVFQLLAARMGFHEPEFRQSAEEIIRDVLRSGGPAVEGITLEQLMQQGTARLNVPGRPHVPFAEGRFPTPSGRVELYSEQLAAAGKDPLPGWVPSGESVDGAPRQARRFPLALVSPASHYFLNSSFGNVPSLIRQAREPQVEIHRLDADARGIADGDWVEVVNPRGACRLRARVTETGVRPGVVATGTVWWNRFSPDGRNANWTTSDALSDYGNGASFHGNLVEVRRTG